MNIDEQLSIWDLIHTEGHQELVPIEGIVNLNSMPISDYKVSLCYGDLKLVIAMIEDYVSGLDIIKANDIQWNAYYRKKFKDISLRIQEQIEYDYQKAKKKCLKESQSESDIGEEAMALMIKKSIRKAMRNE